VTPQHDKSGNLFMKNIIQGCHSSAEIPRILRVKKTFSEDQNFPHLIKFNGFCHCMVAATALLIIMLNQQNNR